MKKHLLDSLVIGFALFSMFFGAGNVIFPPYLGLESGPEWLLGFLSYFLADIGLAMLAMFAILRQGSPDGITARIGKLPSTVLMCAIVLCIGPMLAIPRTAATTYETSLAPLVAGFSPVLFSILFFLLILLLCVRETAVVDIVGKILTPALLIGLLVLIVIGVVNPIGPVGRQPLVENAINHGFRDINYKGLITIRNAAAPDASEYLRFEINDNGKGMDYSGSSLPQSNNKSGGYGLVNVNERLIMEYGSESAISFQSDPDTGTTVSFLIRKCLIHTVP